MIGSERAGRRRTLADQEDTSAFARATARLAAVRSSESVARKCYESQVSGGLYMFLRNEPTVLRWRFRCIDFRYKTLCRLQDAFAGGFVLENEPNSRGVLAGLNAVKRRINPFENRSVRGRCYFFFSPRIMNRLESRWCGRCLDKSRNPAGSRRMTGLGMTD